MTQAMEIHDAKLLEIVHHDDGSGHVLFHACIYRSQGVVFMDPCENGWQNLRLLFEGMWIDGERVAPGEYASEGELWINGSSSRGMITLPADHDGDLRLELMLSPLFATITIHAAKVRSAFEGPWDFEANWDGDGIVTFPADN